MALAHVDFEHVLARSTVGAMTKKFLKMSGTDAIVKRNKRLHSVVTQAVERSNEVQRESSMRIACASESVRGSAGSARAGMLARVAADQMSSSVEQPAWAVEASTSHPPSSAGDASSARPSACSSVGELTRSATRIEPHHPWPHLLAHQRWSLMHGLAATPTARARRSSRGCRRGCRQTSLQSPRYESLT
jgi:hypothetical protein